MDEDPTPQQYLDAIDILVKSNGKNFRELVNYNETDRIRVQRYLKALREGKNLNDEKLMFLSNILEFVDVSSFKNYCLAPASNGCLMYKDCIQIGKLKTLWFRAIGSGIRRQEIMPENIIIKFDDKDIVFGRNIDGHVTRTRNLVKKDGVYRSENGTVFTNNSIYAISNLSTWPPVGHDEDRSLELTLLKTDYAAFWTMLNVENAKRERMNCLRQWNLDDGFDSLFGLGVGVNVAIFTSDDKMIFAVRSSTQGARRDELDVGSVEGLSFHRDPPPSPSLLKVCERAVNEEFAIEPSHVSGMYILGFGFDMQYCQWNAIAVCYTNMNSERLTRRQNQFANDVREFKGVYAISSEPEYVASWLSKQDRILWSCGLATTFYALIHKYGAQKVEDAFETFNVKEPERYVL